VRKQARVRGCEGVRESGNQREKRWSEGGRELAREGRRKGASEAVRQGTRERDGGREALARLSTTTPEWTREARVETDTFLRRDGAYDFRVCASGPNPSAPPGPLRTSVPDGDLMVTRAPGGRRMGGPCAGFAPRCVHVSGYLSVPPCTAA
jgi:hypothetical protein